MKLPKRLRKNLYYSLGTLYLAGIGYWLSILFFKIKTAFGDEPGFFERILGPLHLSAAFFFIFVLGHVWVQHIRPSLKKGPNRPSGWLFLILIALMALTGITMLYGNEDLIKLISKIHPWIGASLLPVVLGHAFFRKTSST